MEPTDQVHGAPVRVGLPPAAPMTSGAVTLRGAAGPRGSAPPILSKIPPRLLLRAGSANYIKNSETNGISAKQLLEQQANTTNAERGELFEYSIDQPISLKRGEASMIPIVSQSIDGEKFSIFDTRDSELHAVNGLRITNSTKLHLAGGPLTVYEDGTYAGDAQITEIAPGESRLISYSLDGNLVISRGEQSFHSSITKFTVKNGVLTETKKVVKTDIYSFHNKATVEKNVLVLKPVQTGDTLTEPAKPSEIAKNEYRFEVPVSAGKTKEFRIVTEWTAYEETALLKSDVDSLIVYSQNAKISPQLKAALAEVVKRRNALTDIQNQRKALQDQIKSISDDQDRIRQNMNSLPRDSDLYKSYMAKLTAQETQLDNLQQQIKKLQAEEVTAQKALNDYVQHLNIES